jgi:hypothetical protein
MPRPRGQRDEAVGSGRVPPGEELPKPEPFIARSCDRLEDALVSYNRAAGIFLRNDSSAAQRVATLHWVLVQELALRAVLREQIDPSLWGAAFLAAMSYLEDPSREERGWAHASLAELWLLKLATSGMPDDERDRPSDRVLEHAEHIAQLYPNEDSFPIRSTRKQLRRYLDWWGEDRLAEVAQRREHRTLPAFVRRTRRGSGRAYLDAHREK